MCLVLNFMIKHMFSRKRKKILTVLLHLSSRWEVCSLQMLSTPGAACASALTEAWSHFCWVESRTFKQEGEEEATFLWGKQKWKCCELRDCQPQQVLTGTRPFQPLPAASWDRNEHFSVLWAASESELLPFCQKTQLPKALNGNLSWAGAWADKIPALDLYFASKYM